MVKKAESSEKAAQVNAKDGDKGMRNEKMKAVDVAMQQIEKQFGKGSIMRFGSKSTEKVDTISTGAISLDIALGIGGIPKGRIVEIYGPESSGKTTLAMHILAEAQNQGGIAAFIDAEHAFDSSYGRKIGINLEELYISQPDYGEQALEILETLVRSGAFDVIVVDSVAALTPKAEIDGEMGDAHMGLQARLMSQALRKLTAITSKTNVTIIFINQLRMKIGIMFGNPETTTGGNALKFYSSIRMDIRRTQTIKEGDTVKGHTVKVKVVKNKMAPPFREAVFNIIYPNGIDKYSSLIDAAIQAGVIERSGAWFRRGDNQIAQGRDATADVLRADPKLTKEIAKEVREKAGI